LIKLGADINKVDQDGMAPIHLAAKNGHKDCLEVIVEEAKLMPSSIDSQTEFLFRILFGDWSQIEK